MSRHSQSKDENMFQHKGAGKQEVGQSSERGLSYKSHISANVWVLSSPERSTEIGLRNGIERSTVKFGSSLKFKNKCSPRGQGTSSDLIKFRMQVAKEKHPLLKSLFSSASSVLALLSHFVPKSTRPDQDSFSAHRACVLRHLTWSSQETG